MKIEYSNGWYKVTNKYGDTFYVRNALIAFKSAWDYYQLFTKGLK